MTSESVWPRVERLLASAERPSRYINSEWGAVRHKKAPYRVALAYPDTYEIGQANQAIAILYELLNSIEDVCAERVYVPWTDMSERMRASSVELATLESGMPLSGVDMLGITLPYELSYTNVLELLDLGGIPLRAVDRDGADPLVVGGGPCVFNPEPVAPFFDAILIGEGEEAAAEIVAAHKEARTSTASRREVLERIARIPGVYVPSLYEPAITADGARGTVRASGDVPATVVKRVVRDLSAHRSPTHPIVPFMEVVHDRYAIEVLRGCSRGCRFCQAGMVYRPVRERSADTIVRDVIEGLRCTGYDEVSLTSLSTTDHSMLEEVLRRLTRRLEGTGVTVSLPSLRVDAFGVAMAGLVARGRKSGLTFAPEAGTQRLRNVINKNVTENDLIDSVSRAFSLGWRRVKLYFMIGLPTETDDDIRGIGDLVSKVLVTAREACPPNERGSVRVSISVSTFVPKAQTPFQWEPQIERAEVLRRQSVLRDAIPRKGVELSWHDSDVSFLEGVMARGDRRIADVIEAAWRSGVRFDAWTECFGVSRWLEAFEATGVDPTAVANRPRVAGEPLPWSHISAGVSETYLMGERERAYAGLTTADCTFEGCTGCDVCGDLGVDVIVTGDRRG